ncbi:hypothetical protein [Rhodoferax sp. WC2427]|uniref:hypothetical protein n=1 Tax=Rhodoferax sp. WC2427 TaxID=3234144 RepID=UPI003466D1C3
MQYYKTPDGQVWAFEADGTQDDLITDDMVVMTPEEVAAHLAPPSPAVPQVVEMVQARLALLHAGHLATVKTAIASMPGLAGDEAREVWEFGPRVRRDSNLVAAMAQVLGLDGAALDALFVDAATR